MLDSWGIEIIIEGEAFLLCGNNRCGAPIDSNILVASIPSLLFRLLIAISSSSSSSLLSSLSCLYPFHRCLSYFSFIARNMFISFFFFFAETKALSHGFGWHRLASCCLPWDFKDGFYFMVVYQTQNVMSFWLGKHLSFTRGWPIQNISIT